ncbi:MAG: TonB family protein [Calditrichia bacterium]
MKFQLFILAFLIVCSLHAQTANYISGKISEDSRWSGNIYIDGDITIPRGVTLVVEAGSRVVFRARYDKTKSGESPDHAELIVSGTLITEGMPRNGRIIFTSDSPEPQLNDWYGIVIKNRENASFLKNCIVEYGYKGVLCYGSSPVIEESEIRFNYYAGISCEVRASPQIRNCVIMGNGFAGINCELASNPVIEKCLIFQNSNGVMIFDRSNPDLGGSDNENGSGGENQIYNNFDTNIYNHSSNDIFARNNNWNMTEEAAIRRTFYDKESNPAYGKILIRPLAGEKEQIARGNSPPSVTGRNPREQNAVPPQNTGIRDNAPDTTSTRQKRVIGTVQKADTAAVEIATNLPDTTAGNVALNSRDIPELNLREAPVEPVIEEPVIEALIDGRRRKYIKRVSPVYPEIYFRTGYEGDVLMEVIVNRDGTIQSYRILKSDGEHFTRAAEKAIQKYLYKPATFRGKPVSFKIIERFRFKLSK